MWTARSCASSRQIRSEERGLAPAIPHSRHTPKSSRPAPASITGRVSALNSKPRTQDLSARRRSLSSTDIGTLRLLDRGLRVNSEDVARARVSFGDLLDLRDVARMCGIQTGKRCLVKGFVGSVQAAETRAGILTGVRGGGDFM